MPDHWENRIPVPKNPTAGKGFTSAIQFFFSNTETEPQDGLVPSYPLLATPSHTQYLWTLAGHPPTQVSGSPAPAAPSC